MRTAATCPHTPNCFHRLDEAGPCDGYNELFQLLGLTRDDVDALRSDGVGYDEGHDQDALDSLAARIAPLLLPR